MADGKSPGLDGIPKEFFSYYLDQLGGDLMGFMKDFERSAILPASAQEAVTVLLHKKEDASVTWEITLERATAKFGKWQVHYLTTTGKVAVINNNVNPLLAFQAQVYAPPPEIWAKIVKPLHNFVSGNHATARKFFVLWSQKLLFKPRSEGGLGVRDPFTELGGYAATRVALLASQQTCLRTELTSKALDIQDLQAFWGHASQMK
ncbi:unnamed protein product [Closterium sp. NIES-54]